MKTALKLGLAVAAMGILANLLGCMSDRDADIPSLVNGGALLIDVRTAGEFSEGHIEGAINIPHNAIANMIDQHEADKSKAIVVYCHSGARSSSAKRALGKAGYTHVVNGGSLRRMRKLLD